MGKGYGERDKDDLLRENASLREQVDYYEADDRKAHNRTLALSYAANLTPSDLQKKAQTVVDDAKIIEAYLNGDTQTDPDTPVPSPS